MSSLAKKIKSRSIFIISGLLIAALALYFLLSPTTSGLKAPIEKQLHAIQIEDMVSAYAFTSLAFQKSTSLSAFKRFVKDYSGLRNNEEIEFNKLNIKNGVGFVEATLISRSGIGTTVTYQLIKEHGRWKIESLILVPQGNEQPTTTTADTTTQQPSQVAVNTKSTVTSPAAKPDISSIYEDTSNQYSLRYPTTWTITKTNDGMTIIHKQDNQTANQTLLSIQPISNLNQPGSISVQQVVDNGEAAIRGRAGNYRVIEDSLLPPGANKNERYHGRYVLYSYTLDDGQPMKQLQVIYFISPNRAQYVLDYTAPEAGFDVDLATARAMIASFKIG
tara:strand:+ start:358 stop:1356 length:999 start_codon:yes stop_codon:yes gene_type:complete